MPLVEGREEQSFPRDVTLRYIGRLHRVPAETTPYSQGYSTTSGRDVLAVDYT